MSVTAAPREARPDAFGHE